MKLSKTEKIIYHYLISNDITHASAESIADALFVSRTSIYRVCKKLGYSSFSHFKYMQTSEKIPKLKDVNSLDVFDHVEDKQLEYIIKQIIASEHIYVFGMHATGMATHYLTRQLVNLGHSSILIADEFEFEARKQMMTEADCIVCFSNSGVYLEEVLEIIENTKACVITVTKEQSSLHQLATYAITFDFPVSKESDVFDRENIFNLIVIAEKILINLKALQPN